ncbi:B12-binding domain-containing radical SAM protein [Phascolarctobacterium faecium]|jgi:Fe-S oxidoreductase|uniref:B12-binding domain-containing radical SAM protein n=1 Tax=Phascolarctobacterium faecium TaxID=33025 RepID=UPI0026663233|nr:radical SAM protein [Phascolarctobacterium faecium]
MKIFLVNPPFKTEYGKFSRDQRSPAITKSGTLYYPTWLACATGVLEEAGYECKFLDCCAKLLNIEATIAIIKDFEPNIIVINTSTPSIYSDGEFAEKIKKVLPNTITVFVGTHPSALPEETLTKFPSVDIIARREYEYTLRELVKKLEANKDISSVLGISYRNGKNEIVNTADRPFIENLDELPFVSKVYKEHGVDPRDYFFAAAEFPMMMIFTGRGCPNNCFFCVYPQTFHGRMAYRLRSPENVVEEIEYILQNFPDLKSLGFEDDTFTADLERTKNICRLIIEKGLEKKINWWVNARVTLDFDTMLLMKQAGCRLLIAGFESGNQQVLENMHKGIKVDWSKKYVENAKKAGLLIHGCFMVGNPGETPETMEETFQLALQLNTDTAQFFPLMVYPGTDAYKWARKNNYLVTEDYSKWISEDGLHNCVISLQGISNKELVEFCDKARKRYYIRANYIFSKIKQFITYPAERKRLFKAGKRFIKFLLKKDE